MKKVLFYTLGCKVNQYETQLIREQFLSRGYVEAAAGEPADVCVVNTCTVTGNADKDSLYHVHRCARQNPQAKIIVTGCMAELDAKLLKAQPQVAAVVRNRDKARLVNACRRVLGRPAGGSAARGISAFAGHSRAFVKIQDGCNNRCSYCKVALVRGPSKSRPVKDILNEAAALVENGFKEIVLTGICLGSFGKDLKPRSSLTGLIAQLEKVTGLARIRLSSIEASDVTPELIAMIARSKKLCRHLHIPIQSGDDTVLRLMNRRYSSSDYLALIARARKAVPGIAITTDVLVGFPGEGEKHFLNTVKLLRRIKPSRMHIFGYSVRQGTPAAALPGHVGRETIKERMNILQEAGRQFTAAFIRQSARKPQRVLFENPVKGKPGWWEGYTDTYLKVQARLPNRGQQVCELRLTESAFNGNITSL